MTPDQQARERLAREATPGPWTTDTDANEQQMVLAVDADFWVALCPHQCLRSIEVQAEKNAAHIAANSPAVILADLARLRALEDEVNDVASKLAVEDARTTRQAKTIRALEDAHEHLARELALAHAEADAATERVQHLLTTIDVERTGRKEAEDEVARLNAMRTHCEHCGADYMATGVEAGCPCRLAEEVARLREALVGEVATLKAATKAQSGTILRLSESEVALRAALERARPYVVERHNLGNPGACSCGGRFVSAGTVCACLAVIDAALHAQDTEVGR